LELNSLVKPEFVARPDADLVIGLERFGAPASPVRAGSTSVKGGALPLDVRGVRRRGAPDQITKPKEIDVHGYAELVPAAGGRPDEVTAEQGDECEAVLQSGG